MASADSVTAWIEQLKGGDADAAQKLWERYCGQLLNLARKKLQAAPLQAADEEDLAQSVFKSFCLRAANGKFGKLADRDDLWHLLFILTESKARNLRRYERRKKRDVGRLVDGVIMQEIHGREPSPAFAAEVAEQCQRLLDRLDDDGLRMVALHKLDGCSNDEIAAKLGCVTRTVERQLRLIRKIWKDDDDADE